eukprot:Opistho-2@16797
MHELWSLLAEIKAPPSRNPEELPDQAAYFSKQRAFVRRELDEMLDGEKKNKRNVEWDHSVILTDSEMEVSRTEQAPDRTITSSPDTDAVYQLLLLEGREGVFFLPIRKIFDDPDCNQYKFVVLNASTLAEQGNGTRHELMSPRRQDRQQPPVRAKGIGNIQSYAYRWEAIKRAPECIHPELLAFFTGCTSPKHASNITEAMGRMGLDDANGRLSGVQPGTSGGRHAWPPPRRDDDAAEPSRHLNKSQQAAISNLQGRIAAIHGPPGTGKSTTICAIVESRFMADPTTGRVLICATTNKAIDALAEKMHKRDLGAVLLAVGNESRLEQLTQQFLWEHPMYSALI